MSKEYKFDTLIAQDGSESIALPNHIAGSGSLVRLIGTTRDYAQQAGSENTLKAYAKDWAHFSRWCRMKGIEPLPPSPEMIGLYLADMAAPGGKTPSLDACRYVEITRNARKKTGVCETERVGVSETGPIS